MVKIKRFKFEKKKEKKDIFLCLKVPHSRQNPITVCAFFLHHLWLTENAAMRGNILCCFRKKNHEKTHFTTRSKCIQIKYENHTDKNTNLHQIYTAGGVERKEKNTEAKNPANKKKIYNIQQKICLNVFKSS